MTRTELEARIRRIKDLRTSVEDLSKYRVDVFIDFSKTLAETPLLDEALEILGVTRTQARWSVKRNRPVVLVHLHLDEEEEGVSVPVIKAVPVKAGT